VEDRKMINPTKQEMANIVEFLKEVGGADEDLLERAEVCINSPISETDFDIMEELLIETGQLM
jgi:hypothetical protein